MLPSRRFAIRFERRFAGSVMRNRIKRWVREILRVEKCRLPPNMDLLLIVKPFLSSQQANLYAMRESFISLCKKAGIWMEGDGGMKKQNP